MSAGQNNAGVAPLTFGAGGVDLEQYIFVDILRDTDEVMVSAGTTPTGITVQPSADDIVAVVSTKSVEAKYFLRAGADVTMGDELESDANGYAIPSGTGGSGVYAKKTVKQGGLIPVYSF